MDARPRDRTPASPVAPKSIVPTPERRPWKPLAFIEFNRATSVPGVKHRVMRLTAGEPVSLSEPQVISPQPFYDTELRLVVIKDRYYPLSSVESFSFARAAKADTTT